MSANYTLKNVVRASEAFETFDVHSHKERSSLRLGDIAKICAEFACEGRFMGERFWVIITKADGGNYRGTIDNFLLFGECHELMHGDEVSFDHRHILDIQTEAAAGQGQ